MSMDALIDSLASGDDGLFVDPNRDDETLSNALCTIREPSCHRICAAC